MRTLCISLLLFVRVALLTAQNQVMVNVALNPPYSQRLSDYEHYQADVLITLTNLTQQDLQMKIVGEINGANTGLFVKTRPEYVPNQIITLAPGESRSYQGNQITGYFDNQNTVRNIPADLEADIARTGLLPQDNYDYCIEVVDINTLAVLGRKCTLLPIQYLSPPQPNLPWCESSQDIHINPLVNFSWLPPVGGGLGQANLQYDFYLVPVPAGQDPGQLLQLAMDGQLPGQFFINRNLMAPAFQYNTLQDPPLTPGLYVWGITARDLNGLVGIENHGQSSFCTLNIQNGGGNGGGNQQVDAFPFDCGCKSALPNGSNSPNLITVGATIKVGAYSMKIIGTDGQGNGTGSVQVPGFPGGVELPLLADFSGLEVNANREMIKGNVRAQRQQDVSFLPDIVNPQLQTVPLNGSQIDQLDQYFDQNTQQLVKNIDRAKDASGFRLPLGLDKNIGGQQIVIAITDMHFDATRAALDAAVVLNLADAGTKIALSGRGICLQNGLELCKEGTLLLAEDLELPAIHIALRGLSHDNDPEHCTRVTFDRDGFKKLYIAGIFTFPEGTLSKVQGGKVEATLSAEADKGWSDWVATAHIDPFRITGVNDFTFTSQTAYYDHSTLYNPPNMPADYDEGKPLTWTGFFLEKLSVELPPILKKRNDNAPLAISANNVIIDSYGVTGSLSVDNILKIGEGGDGHWQFSVDQFFVKFKKNTFQSGGFNGKLLLPITSRNEQSSLIYSTLLSYANSQFSYQFTIQPKNDIEVDLFAAYFSLSNSSIQVSAGGGQGFRASAILNGEFRIGGKFSDQLPRIDIAHVSFQNLGLTSVYPYFTPGQLQAGLASPQKSVGGFPFNIEDMELVGQGEIALKMKLDLQLSDLAGFLPNAEATMKFKGKFNPDFSPAFVGFEMSKIHVEGNFSFLKINGDLEFYSKDATWGDGFQGKVDAEFPPGFSLSSRMQIGDDPNNVNYWYVDGQLGKKSAFTAGLNAYGFSGGAYYNIEPGNFKEKTDITSSESPDNYNWLGGAPSQVTYKVKPGSAGMMASAVVGLGTKELFNANGAFSIKMINGGVDELAFSGSGRMFGDPGSKGLVNGAVGFRYGFAQKVLDINGDLSVNIVPGVSASAYLSMHSNGATGQWNFKVGRPLGWGPPGGPCTLKFDFPPAPVRVEAGIYFQCGNFDVDGLPKRLPDLMQSLFPEYPKGYVRQISGQNFLDSGNGIAVGAYLQADLTLTYLIFYARFSAVFGFDMQIKKVTEGCDRYPVPGLNGWYGTGQFYAGIKFAIGIHVDLLFVSGDFEILSLSFGGILTGGGPNPTWVRGEVGGGFSILGGLISGYCHFHFQAGDVCIPLGDPLANLKLINETFPADGKELQSIDIDPAVSTNLAMDREFILDQQIVDKDGNPATKPRLFRFNKSDLTISLSNSNQPNQELLGLYDYDPEGFGAAKVMDKMLDPGAQHIFKVKATVQECYNIQSLSQGHDAQGRPLTSGTCPPDGWGQAKLKNNQPFADTRTIIFKTDAGLKRLGPDRVVYSLPHHSQRFFCYQDIAQQTFMGLNKGVYPKDFNRSDADIGVPRTLKVRLLPINASQGILKDISVPVSVDDGLSGGELGPYDEYGATHYWTAAMWADLRPNTTYSVQFFVEFENPQGQQGGNNQPRSWMRTVTQTRMLIDSVEAQERKINREQFKLKKSQMEVYRYYFRTGRYGSIEKKLADLDRNQLVFSEYQADHTKPKSFSIAGDDLRDWNSIIQTLKGHFSPEVLNPPDKALYGIPEVGICLTKLGLLGPERFDVFDMEGTYKTTTGQNGAINHMYRIKPLISFDQGVMKHYWDQVFKSALDTLLANGIQGNVEMQSPHYMPWDTKSLDRMGGKVVSNDSWYVENFHMKVFGVMGPIDTTHLLDNNAQENMQMLPVNLSGLQSMHAVSNSPKNAMLSLVLGQPAKPNLIEISRDLNKETVDRGWKHDLGNLWVNAAIDWSNIPGPALPDKFFSGIGAAFDVINQSNPPAFQLNDGPQGIGAGVQINLIGNGGVRPQFRLGPR